MFCCPMLFIVVFVVVFFFLRQHITTRNNIVRAVCCEQKIQPRIARICTNGDVMQKFFRLAEKNIRVNSCNSWLKIYVPSLARNPFVVLCCPMLFLLSFSPFRSAPREDTSWRLRLEISDSSLRNAPRSVSRASTSFRDDCRGGLSVFCCPMLF